MNFNINNVLADMLSAMKGTFSDNWKKVEPEVTKFMQERKGRLDLLTDLLLKGDISKPQFDSRLEDEKKVLEAEFLAIKVITKAMAQKAANAAFDVLTNAILKAIKALL